MSVRLKEILMREKHPDDRKPIYKIQSQNMGFRLFQAIHLRHQFINRDCRMLVLQDLSVNSVEKQLSKERDKARKHETLRSLVSAQFMIPLDKSFALVQDLILDELMPTELRHRAIKLASFQKLFKLLTRDLIDDYLLSKHQFSVKEVTIKTKSFISLI